MSGELGSALWLSRVGWRLATVAVGVCVLAGIVVLRASQLAVQPPQWVAQLAARDMRPSQEITQPRGSVYDRNLQVLALSLPVQTLALDGRHFQNRPEDWAALQQIVAFDETKARSRYQKNQTGVTFLRRHLSHEQEMRIRQQAIPGAVLVPEVKRYYPLGEALAPVIGLTDIDGKGREGLEAAYNHLLAASPEVRSLTVGRPQGQSLDLQLTLDMNLQYQAYRKLKQAVLANGAKGGSVTLVDIASGEILALASYPSFNPNNRKNLNIHRNRAAMDLLEPGSIFKPFTLAAALQTGDWQAESRIDTAPGHIRLDSGEQFADLRNHGRLSLSEVLIQSSNVGAVRLGLSLKPQDHLGLLRRLGFGSITGIGLPGEAEGSLPQARSMRQVQQATLSFGYGCTVTPLQLARAYSALGNKGILMPLKLIRGASVQEPVQAMSPTAAAEVLSMLERVVSEGTGRRAAIEGYAVAGKTGTVHLAGRGGYEQDRYRALFAGLVPADKPRLALVITVDEPRRDFYYGGQVAAPLFASIAHQALQQLGIVPQISQQAAEG